jgi:hypothetical protein
MSATGSDHDFSLRHLLVVYRWPLMLIGLALIVLAGYLISLRTTKQIYDQTMDRAARGMENAARGVDAMAEKFKQGTITHTFMAAIPEMSSTGMGNLELATARATERFSTADTRTIAWDLIPLGTTTSEIEVPVTYRYHLRLSDPWQIDVSGQTCIVKAPKIRPSLPPAIHTDQMQKKSERGWARLNEREQMAELERSLTPELSVLAGNRKHIALVREECRKTVGEFVKNWLLREEHWRSDRFHAIIVIFADEQNGTPELRPPTIELKE